jgi:hypothetical protein
MRRLGSGRADNGPAEQCGRGSTVALPLEELDPRDERTESAVRSIVKPPVEIANALAHNQPTKTLQQLVTSSDAPVVSKNVVRSHRAGQVAASTASERSPRAAVAVDAAGARCSGLVMAAVHARER